MTGPQPVRVSELVVDPAGSGVGEAVGLSGDAAGLPGRHLEAFEALPQEGMAVAQVEGVRDQLRAGRR